MFVHIFRKREVKGQKSNMKQGFLDGNIAQSKVKECYQK